MQACAFISPETGNNQLLFMPSLYNDTVNLLIEARDYFTHFSSEDQSRLTPMERLTYNAEMSRITLRLSSVMAWLLARRASTGGMASPESSLHEYRLQFRHICLDEGQGAKNATPAYVQLLLERTQALYARVCRLCDMSAAQGEHA